MTYPSPTVQRKTVRLPPVIYILAVGTTLMGTTEFVIAGLLPDIAADFDVTIAEAGLAITVFAIGMILGAPTMAMLTLRLPRRLTLTLALIIFAIGHVVAAVSTDFAIMLAARFVTAVATGAFWSVASIVATDTVGPNSRSRALGIVLGGGMLANVLGVPLGSFAGQLLGWRVPFWVLAGLAGMSALAVARLVPADTPRRTIPSLRAELAAFRSIRLWLALATCAMVTGGTLSTYSFISPLLTDRAGLPSSAVPVALIAFGLAALIGSILGGRLGDSYPYAIALGCAVTTVIVAAALCVVSNNPVLTLITFSILGLTGLSANPILISLAIHFGGVAPTLAAAMTTSAFNLGIAAGTTIAAVTLETDLGVLGAPIVGTVSSALVLVPLTALIFLQQARVATPRCSDDGTLLPAAKR